MGVLVVAPASSHYHDSLFSSHHHHLQHQDHHPIIPLISPQSGSIQWQNQNPNPSSSNPKSSSIPILDTTATCQDCGNQAKKDCSHRRCRTCCKSRGLDCTTHVKSTWVPAARRRERAMSGGAPPAGSSASTSATKKPRLLSSQTTTTSHTSTSNTTRSFDTSSSHQDASFREGLPPHVRAPAVFKCVRVTSIEDDGEDEYAYQAMVKIGGHVFKGFLYDQGADDGRSENLANAIPNISGLHLGGGASGGGSGADIAGLLGGTNYGNQIN